MNPIQAQTTTAFQDSDLKNISDMISSFVGNNKVAISELPNTLSQIISSYNQLRAGVVAETTQNSAVATAEEPRKPAVPVSKSVKPDYLVCLLDGGHFKSLKKHLKSKYGMTPDQYREMFGLKADYPMVAPNYSKARSELAKAAGLGRTSHERVGRKSRVEATTAKRASGPTKNGAKTKRKAVAA